MERLCFSRCRFSRSKGFLQLTLTCFLILIGLLTLHHLYSSSSLLLHDSSCSKFHAIDKEEAFANFDLKALSERVDEVLAKLSDLQDKLERTVQHLKKELKTNKKPNNMTRSEFKRYLEEEIIQPLYTAHITLRLVRIPKLNADNSTAMAEDPLINFFTVEEIRKYITSKSSREGKLTVFGTNKTHSTIGHACVLMRKELEEYMNYDVGSYCKDDWDLAQKLMLGGCDPLPRRRCLARAPKLYQQPLGVNQSMWQIPDDRNVRWSHYRCRGFKCLSSKNPNRGFSKCTACFELEKEKEKERWVKTTSASSSFLIADVLSAKPMGEVRIGLDVSFDTGSFAARMKDWNVTIVTTAVNIGAPFSETIALRGLVPLYVSLNQRLPFFDNTMDLIHTGVLLDGWVDLQMLDFVLFDWDRVLRPGGLLWVDRFFCKRKDLDDYMFMFLQFRYKKRKWVVSFKSQDEVYLSALLEKPPRSL